MKSPEIIIKTQSEQINRLTNEISYLKEKIDYLLRDKFSSKSEKFSNQPSLFNQTDLETVKVEDDPKEIKISYVKRKGGRTKPPESLPHIRVEHDINEKEKVCRCGCNMVCIKEIITHQYDVIPAEFRVIQNVRLVYSCGSKCGAKLKTAPVALSVLPRHQVTPSFLATIGVQKFEDGLPLTRQAKIFKNRFGVQFTDTTLSNWMIKASELCLTPLIEKMNTLMIESDYIQADETTLQVLKEENKKATSKSYLWLRVNKDEDKKIVLMNYSSNRGSNTASSLLKGFKGYLQTDGYPGYDPIAKKDGITQLGCWAHGRRRFADIIKSGESCVESKNIAKEIISLISKLYKVEKEIKTLPPDIKQKRREEESKPVIDEIDKWLERHITKANEYGGKLKTAVNYLYRQFPKLIIYLEDGRLDIDNNRVENHVRPIAIGRKNWLFATSTKGANCLANWYSIIESAKINNLDPYRYLCYVFTMFPVYNYENRDIDSLLPWNVVLD